MSYDTVYPEGMPMIYCGTAVLLLVPLFFLNNKISMKEKTSTGLLTMCLVILMYIKPADMAMHGFKFKLAALQIFICILFPAGGYGVQSL